MKVKNTLSQVVHLVLEPGKEIELQKDQTIEMPEWVFKMLVNTFPGLKAVKEEVKIAGEPAKIQPKVSKNETAKNDKVKKSGK